MSRIETKWLLYAAALAVGEGIAAYLSRGAVAWPAALILTSLISLFGFGYRLRGWTFVALAALGVVLTFHASLAREEELRRSPWLRGRPRATWACTRSSFGASIRADLSERVGIGLDDNCETVMLNRAILLGERSNLPKATKKIFVESGTIHVFAISGLHVMIIARLIIFLMAVVFVPYRFQGALALPLVWGYVIIIGAPPSSVRAAVMASFYFLAPVFRRRPNGLVAWALAFLIVHLLNPIQITDVGSQLSFAVMLSLILAARLSRAAILRRWEGLFITVVAWAAGVPIAAMVFARITPGGIIANLFLLVAAGYSVVAGAVGVLVSYLSETLAIHCNNFSALSTEMMVVISNLVARLPGANFEIQSWSFFAGVVWYVALALGLFTIYRLIERRNLI